MALTITSTTTEFVTLAEVKAHANISGTTDDTEINRFRLVAQEQVEALIGPVLWRTVTETTHAHDKVVVLASAPVVSVESLTSSGAAVTGYTLRKPSGLLTGVSATGDLSVSYTAGRSEAPESVRVAAMIIAEHLWRTQRGNAPSALPADVDPEVVSLGAGFAIPRKAAELLAPYLLTVGFA